MADILTREADLIKNEEGGNVARLEANKIILEDGAAGGSSFSTEEKKIGKWIDGRAVYSKLIEVGTNIELVANTDIALESVDISEMNLVVEAYFILTGDTTAVIPAEFSLFNGKLYYYLSHRWAPSNNRNVNVFIKYVKGE